MKMRNSSPVALACFGQEVSFQSPFFAVIRQGAAVAIGDVCELVDLYAIPVFVREDGPWVDYLRMYESCHHIFTSHDQYRLYCAYVSLSRLILAMRNNKSFALNVINAPLDIIGDRL